MKSNYNYNPINKQSFSLSLVKMYIWSCFLK